VVRVAGVAGGNHDVIALMDGSGSLGAEDWTRSKLALTALVNTFEWGPSLNRLGILRYSTGVDTIVPLNFPLQNADSSDVNQDILNASIAGMTYPRGYAYMKDAVEAAIGSGVLFRANVLWKSAVVGDVVSAVSAVAASGDVSASVLAHDADTSTAVAIIATREIFMRWSSGVDKDVYGTAQGRDAGMVRQHLTLDPVSTSPKMVPRCNFPHVPP
jgi:hypothetical protein